MDLSIVIVNNNEKKFCIKAVDSVINTVKNISYEIIVINTSNKEKELFSSYNNHVKIIDIENKTFSAACNIGANKAIGRFILFLNSNVVVQNDSINKSFDYIDKNKNVGVLGVKAFFNNGKFNENCKRNFSSKNNFLYSILEFDKLLFKLKIFKQNQSFFDKDKIQLTDSILGPFILISNTLFVKTGGFDEDFPIYIKDLDLCLKAKNLGFDIIYYGEVFIIESLEKEDIYSKNINSYYKNLKQFYYKYYADENNLFMRFFIITIINLKCIFSLIKNI